MTGRLKVVDGPNVGAVFELVESSCVLGRALDCQVHLKDLRVSRRHARIVHANGRYAVEDLGSGNGTYVNEQLVKRQQLKSGDVIRVSKIRLLFEEGGLLAVEDEPELVTMVGAIGRQPQIVQTLDAMRSPFASAQSLTNIDELHRMASRLSTVYAVAEVIISILDVEELLPEILNRLFGVFPSADRALIMLYDESGALVPKVMKRRGKEAAKEIKVSQTILNTVLSQKHAVLSHDAMTDARFVAGKSVANFGIRSMVCAPLLWRNETLGIVYLDSPSLGAFSQPDLELLAGIAGQAAMALGNAKLHAELMKRQRLEQDLHLAERIQQSFLPRKIPEIEGYSFAAWYEPAYEIGGDFYDFIRLPNDDLGIVVGDVSGKGVSAALYMARLTRDIRYFALAEDDPGRVLTRMNRAVIESGQDDIFVTLLYAVLNPVSGQLSIANAGHMPPISRRPGRTPTVMDRTSGLPLGVLPDTEYECETHDLGPGEVLLFYTDGLVEAMNHDREMFGSDRLLRAVGRTAGRASEILDATIKEMGGHVGGAAQFDDTTIVCLGLDA